MSQEPIGPIQPPKISSRLQQFFDYWNKLVKEGNISELSGVEIMVLKLYDEWLIANKSLRDD